MSAESGTTLLGLRRLTRPPAPIPPSASGRGPEAGCGFHLPDDETLALVGESAGGPIATAILRAVDPAGKIVFTGRGRAVDVAAVGNAAVSGPRRRLSLRAGDGFDETALRQVGEMMAALWRRGERGDQASAGVPARAWRDRARFLASYPRLVVCVERVAPAERASQVWALDLLLALRRRFGLSYLVVASDLATVARVSDRIAVLHSGRMVELAPADRLCRAPSHPYTMTLLSPALLSRHSAGADEAESGRSTAPAGGCSFRAHCPFAQEVCAVEAPPLRAVGDASEGRLAACHFAPGLDVAGPLRAGRLATVS